jgi:hypothetical protein
MKGKINLEEELHTVWESISVPEVFGSNHDSTLLCSFSFSEKKKFYFSSLHKWMKHRGAVSSEVCCVDLNSEFSPSLLCDPSIRYLLFFRSSSSSSSSVPVLDIIFAIPILSFVARGGMCVVRDFQYYTTPSTTAFPSSLPSLIQESDERKVDGAWIKFCRTLHRVVKSSLDSATMVEQPQPRTPPSLEHATKRRKTESGNGNFLFNILKCDDDDIMTSETAEQSGAHGSLKFSAFSENTAVASQLPLPCTGLEFLYRLLQIPAWNVDTCNSLVRGLEEEIAWMNSVHSFSEFWTEYGATGGLLSPDALQEHGMNSTAALLKFCLHETHAQRNHFIHPFLEKWYHKEEFHTEFSIKNTFLQHHHQKETVSQPETALNCSILDRASSVQIRLQLYSELYELYENHRIRRSRWIAMGATLKNILIHDSGDEWLSYPPPRSTTTSSESHQISSKDSKALIVFAAAALHDTAFTLTTEQGRVCDAFSFWQCLQTAVLDSTFALYFQYCERKILNLRLKYGLLAVNSTTLSNLVSFFEPANIFHTSTQAWLHFLTPPSRATAALPLKNGNNNLFLQKNLQQNFHSLTALRCAITGTEAVKFSIHPTAAAPWFLFAPTTIIHAPGSSSPSPALPSRAQPFPFPQTTWQEHKKIVLLKKMDGNTYFQCNAAALAHHLKNTVCVAISRYIAQKKIEYKSFFALPWRVQQEFGESPEPWLENLQARAQARFSGSVWKNKNTNVAADDGGVGGNMAGLDSAPPPIADMFEKSKPRISDELDPHGFSLATLRCFDIWISEMAIHSFEIHNNCAPGVSKVRAVRKKYQAVRRTDGTYDASGGFMPLGSLDAFEQSLRDPTSFHFILEGEEEGAKISGNGLVQRDEWGFQISSGMKNKNSSSSSDGGSSRANVVLGTEDMHLEPLLLARSAVPFTLEDVFVLAEKVPGYFPPCIARVLLQALHDGVHPKNDARLEVGKFFLSLGMPPESVTELFYTLFTYNQTKYTNLTRESFAMMGSDFSIKSIQNQHTARGVPRCTTMVDKGLCPFSTVSIGTKEKQKIDLSSKQSMDVEDLALHYARMMGMHDPSSSLSGSAHQSKEKSFTGASKENRRVVMLQRKYGYGGGGGGSAGRTNSHDDTVHVGMQEKFGKSMSNASKVQTHSPAEIAGNYGTHAQKLCAGYLNHRTKSSTTASNSSIAESPFRTFATDATETLRSVESMGRPTTYYKRVLRFIFQESMQSNQDIIATTCATTTTDSTIKK